MKHLPNPLYMVEYLELMDIQHYIFSCKTCKEVYVYYMKKKRQFINNYFPIEIQALYPHFLMRYPIIHFQTKYLKMNYFSNIKYKDVDYPISIGITKEKCPFIIIKYKQYHYNKKKTNERVILIIQRTQGQWSCSSCYKDDINSHEKYRMYYMWYDTSTQIYRKSQTNEMIKYLSHGRIIYAQHEEKRNTQYYEYYLS